MIKLSFSLKELKQAIKNENTQFLMCLVKDSLEKEKIDLSKD